MLIKFHHFIIDPVINTIELYIPLLNVYKIDFKV